MPPRKKSLTPPEETPVSNVEETSAVINPEPPKPRRRAATPRKKPAVKPAEVLAEKEEPSFMVQEAEEMILTPSPKFYRRIALTFLGAAVLVVLAVLYFTSGSAEINLSLKNKDVKVDTTVNVVAKASGKTEISGVVVQNTVKGKKAFSVSGGGSPVIGVATGKAIIYNKRPSAQTLIATTRLLSPNNVLFRLKNTVSVPANGQIEADVYADKPGADGEIEPTQFVIPGLSVDLQKVVYAESKSKMVGGVRYTKVLTDTDIKSAVDSLANELFQNFQTQIKTSSSLASYTGSLFSYTQEQVKNDPAVGASADQFNITITLKVSGIFYTQTDVNKYLSEQMRSSLADYEVLSGVPTKPVVEVTRFDAIKGTAELHLTQTASAKVSYLEDVIDKSKILGKDKIEVESYLKSLPWVSGVSIKTSPSWMKNIPSEMSKVKIKVNQ